MCLAARFTFDEKDWQVRFTQATARLPVLTKTHDHYLMPWGRRKGEQLTLPMGGWARLTHIQGGRWDVFQPVPVKIPVSGFMEQDVMGNEQWHLVTAGQYLQGLMARANDEQRLYVVILESGPDETYFERWPRIVSRP